MNPLSQKRCSPCTGETPKLAAADVDLLLPSIAGYSVDPGYSRITKTYRFPNFHETMAFVNALAWVAHREDHHPDLEVSYGSCKVSYSTHAIDGLSENDFICAAKVDALPGV
jgi:4a-hydroxytetrahydrobiopterin dehydratase